jgi:hypothetical protein
MQSNDQRLNALSYRSAESPAFLARNAMDLSIE